MIGKLACALVAVAACGESPGVYLTIKGNGLSEVAVYVGEDTCSDSSGAPCGIAPMGGFDRVRPMAPGGTWFRDAKGAFVAGASGGTARVRIEPSGNAKTVQVIVLGLDIQGQAVAAKVVRDLAVPANDATSVSLTLDAATMFDNKPHASGTFVDVWTDPSAINDCVLVQSWDNGVAMDTFIVPQDDGDCDGVATLDASGQPNAKECDPYWYMAGAGMTATTAANCAENRDPVAGHMACQLGGQACVDGVGLGSGCVREEATTCVPDAICNSPCMNPGDTTPFSTCVTAGGGTLAGIHCIIYRDDTGSPCSGTFSTATHGTLDLAMFFANSTRSIDEIDFAYNDNLYTTQLDNGKLLISAATTVELDFTQRSATPLAFDVMWKNGTSFGSTFVGPKPAVADIKVDNGNHLRMPVRIDVAGCTGGTYTGPDGIVCYATPPDNIKNCAM